MKNKSKTKIILIAIIVIVVVLISLIIFKLYNKNNADKLNASVSSLYNLDNCGSPIYEYPNNSNKKIYKCLDGFILRKDNNSNNHAGAMQDFAVTSKYIYFSIPFDADNTIAGSSRTYVVRVNRKTGKREQMYVNYAGHAQSFDVVQNGTHDVDGKTIVDQLFMNGFSYDNTYQGSFRGVYYTVFKSGRKYPGNNIAIKKNNKKLAFEKVTTKQYLENGKLNSKKYYNTLTNIGKNSKYMGNPELAVSDDGKTIAFFKTINPGFDGGNANVYIYSMKDFKKLKGENISYNYSVKYKGNKQGVEIDNKYFYVWSEYITSKEHYVSLYKYNIKTGKKVGGTTWTNSFLLNLAKNKGYSSWEAEGISVYKGKIYLGIVYRGNNLPTINNIYMMSGI